MAEAWLINATPTLHVGTSYYNFTANFVSKGIHFSSMKTFKQYGTDILAYDETQVITYGSWINQDFRTVVFETAPTGGLLTWLQANAVKQATGYSITYHANGGTPIPTDLLVQTNLPNPLPTVSKANFTFDGWYLDNAFQARAVAGAAISADTDLYAKFTKSHITLDLSTIGLPEGTHSIQMKLSDDGVTKADSELSNSVTYTVYPPMPSIGQLITMNLDGSNRQYRVLKVAGTQAEVLCMSDVGQIRFGSNNTYAGGDLDTYLNSTWYNTLTAIAKAAIVSKTFNQDSWYTSTSGSPVYSGFYGTTAPGTYPYDLSKGSSTYGTQITRNVYALGVQDVIDYVTNTDVGDGKLQNYNIWKMFWNITTQPSEIYIALRSAGASDTRFVARVSGRNGNIAIGYEYASYQSRVQPALTIDLSKISWS